MSAFKEKVEEFIKKENPQQVIEMRHMELHRKGWSQFP